MGLLSQNKGDTRGGHLSSLCQCQKSRAVLTTPTEPLHFFLQVAKGLAAQGEHPVRSGVKPSRETCKWPLLSGSPRPPVGLAGELLGPQLLLMSRLASVH